MANQRQDLLGLWVCWLLPNRDCRYLYLPTDSRGHSVFGPYLNDWYEQYMNLLFVGGSDWGPLGGACRGITPPSPCCPKTSSLYFWLGIVYNFDTTKILVIVVSRGRGDELSVAILCISILSVVIPVPYLRGCCRSSLSRPWWRGGLQNSGCTAFLSASQYFNIIVWGLLACVVCFFHLGHHPRPCNWRVRLPLFRFDPFSLLLELSSLLDLAIAQYLLDPIVFNRYHYLCRVLSCWLK